MLTFILAACIPVAFLAGLFVGYRDGAAYQRVCGRYRRA